LLPSELQEKLGEDLRQSCLALFRISLQLPVRVYALLIAVLPANSDFDYFP